MTERLVRAEQPPTEARELLLYRVRAILRHLPGVLLFQDAAGLPLGVKDTLDVGWPDIVGVQEGHCPHLCRVSRPFAFLVQVHGEKVHPIRDHWLARLRGYGWITAIVADPADAKAALSLAATVLSR